MFELSGTIKVIKPAEQINDRFRKREFVIDENSGPYPQVILFELTQDKCEVLDQFKEGDRVKVSFNVRGREWSGRNNETRYFVSLNAWKIESLDNAASGSPAPGAQPEHSAVPPAGGAPPHTANDAPAEEEDDLPF